MKGWLWILWLLLPLLLLCACRAATVTPPVPENDATRSTALVYTDPILYTLETKEAYREYIRTHTIHPKFIGCDRIEKATRGEFVSARLCPVYPKEYSYRLRDENGYEFHLRIEHIDDPDDVFSSNTVLAFSGQADLREYPQKVTGTMPVSNAEYFYFKGTLNAIRWYSSNVEFTLTGYNSDSDPLGEYPQSDNNTFIQRLLSTDTASASISAFVQQITDKSVTE